MNRTKLMVVGAFAALLSVSAADAGQFKNDGYGNDGYGNDGHGSDGNYNDGYNGDRNGGCGGGGGGSSCTPISLDGTSADGSVAIWNFTCAGGLGAACADALPSNPGLSGHQIYSGLYTGPISFQLDHGAGTIGAFTASAGGSFSSPLTNSEKNKLISTGFTPPFCVGNYCVPSLGKVTIMEFTFTLGSKSDLTIQHDDGISIWNSNNTVDFLDSSNPTSIIGSEIVLGAGTYNLWYAEVNGLPADLLTCVIPVVQNVPEPLSLSIFGAGLFGAAAMRRRRKNLR